MRNYGIMICTGLSAAALRRKAGYEKRRRPAMRMMAIANALDGYDRHEAARLAGMSDQALRDAIKRYNASGLDGLYDRPKPGRPRKLDRAREAELSQAILAGPDPETEGLSAYTPDEHVALVLDQAGWHGAKALTVPDSMTLVPLPPYSPELNPVERVWLYLKERFLSHRLLDDYDAIVGATCAAWNRLRTEVGRITSLCSYPWIEAVNSTARMYTG